MDGTTFNTWDFDVEMQEVYDRNGNIIDGSQAVVRTDTDQVLGVHGSRYHLVRHDDVVNSILDAVHRADIGTDYQVKVIDLENGRKMRGEILFNDLVAEPAVGDYVKFRVSFFNSYDASWPFSQAADGLRLWCTNGCTSPDHAAVSRFKHTANINVAGSAAKVGRALENFMTMPNRWRLWMATPVSQGQALDFFSKTLAATPGSRTGKVNDKQLNLLLGLYDKERLALGANQWALYNAMTYWASHTQDLASPEVARRRREDMLVSAMRTSHWLGLN